MKFALKIGSAFFFKIIVGFKLLPSMEFSRQEYWSGLPCPPPGDLLHLECFKKYIVKSSDKT